MVRAAGRDPAGDLVEVDAAREIVDVPLDDLADLQLDERGPISIEQIDLSLSRRAREAQDQAPGNATDAVIWEEVESRTGNDSALAGGATLTVRRWGVGRRARRQTRPTRSQWQRGAFRARTRLSALSGGGWWRRPFHAGNTA